MDMFKARLMISHDIDTMRNDMICMRGPGSRASTGMWVLLCKTADWSGYVRVKRERAEYK